MRKKLTGVFTLMVTILTITAYAQTPDFTGNWKRNDAQCDAGGLSMNSIPVSVTISKDSKAIYIKGTLKKGDSVIHVSMDTLNLDSSKKISNHPTSKKQTIFNWSADQKGFTVSVTISDANGALIQQWNELYSLANDGKSLKVGVDLEMNGNEYHLDELFDKE
jgi:hypothetical protein